MEFFEHGDLQAFMGRPFPEAEAVRITKQVLEGLVFMHDNQFAHRDLKPKVCFALSSDGCQSLIWV